MTDRRSASLFLILAMIVAACSAGPGSGGRLEGVEWILRSYAQGGDLVLVPETQYADAEFTKHSVSGLSGCNRYDALQRSGGRTLLVSQPAVTLMACDEESMAFEQAFLTALQASRYHSVHRDTLTIFGSDRVTLLVFDASPRNPLLGTWQVDSFATDANTVAAPIEDTELEVVFGLASIGGSAGCNSFSGTYGTNGNVVRVSRLATTQIACDEAVMEQEVAFLAALQGVAFLDRQASAMLLTDRSGSVRVALTRPVVEEAPVGSPEPSEAATERPEPTEPAEPTEEPTATATPTPPPTPSPTPAEPTSAPPPIILPAVTSCDLLVEDTMVATIVYPAVWSTVSEPAELACRYFDPEPITVPDDPTTLVTAIMVTTSTSPYADAVAAATDAAAWDVREQAEIVIDDLAATLVEAQATTDEAGIVAGTSRLAFLIDLGAAGTLTLLTIGTADDESYAARAAMLTLMVALSTFTAPDS